MRECNPKVQESHCKGFDVIPAIDIRGGRCVRLTQGDYSREVIYGEDPSDFARQWKEEGAKRIHVVDLDGARVGRPVNLEAIAKMTRATDIPIQVGGGIRSIEAARQLLDAGADRVIVGTRAAQDPAFAEELFRSLGEKVILGIDSQDGMVRVSGWESSTEWEMVAFAREMVRSGAHRIIFTDIARDGMLTGVNVTALLSLLNGVDVPIIASGGVSSLMDIVQLRGMGHPRLEGVIVGKALYEGRFQMRETFAPVIF